MIACMKPIALAGRTVITDTRPQQSANHDFLIGLMTGSAIGAGLAILFAPRLTSEHQGASDPATDPGHPMSPRSGVSVGGETAPTPERVGASPVGR